MLDRHAGFCRNRIVLNSLVPEHRFLLRRVEFGIPSRACGFDSYLRFHLTSQCTPALLAEGDTIFLEEPTLFAVAPGRTRSSSPESGMPCGNGLTWDTSPSKSPWISARPGEWPVSGIPGPVFRATRTPLRSGLAPPSRKIICRIHPSSHRSLW